MRESNDKVKIRVLYLTAMSLFPRVIPTSSLKMKIRVAPRYHLMLWSPSHCGNFSTHGSCTSVPSSACFTLFSHGSLLPETTYANAVNCVQFVHSFVRLPVCLPARCLQKGWSSVGMISRRVNVTVLHQFTDPILSETVIKPSSRTVIRENTPLNLQLV